MKAVIFGTGHVYQVYKKYLKDIDVIAFLDNSDEKVGMHIDGIQVCKPEKIIHIKYDIIFVLSNYADEMTKQLLSLGVELSLIRYSFDLARVYDYKIDKVEELFSGFGDSKSVALISDDLKFSGAQLDLLDVGIALKKNGYKVVMASPVHGKLEMYLDSEGIPLIIDERIAVGRLTDLEWVKKFDLVFVNCITYFGLLLERNYRQPVIWWSHEPELFFRYLFREKMSDIRPDNLFVYAVSEQACRSLKEYCKKVSDVGVFTIGRKRNDNENTTIRIVDNRVRILIIGEIGQLKGQDILCRAIQKLTEKEKKEISVHIIGRIQLGYDCSFINEAGQDCDVKLIEELPKESLYDEYRDGDIIVCASKAESLSAVVVEGMMYGLLPIVSDAAGIVDFLNDGYDSYIFESQNSDELSEKIRLCLSDRNRLYEMRQRALKVYRDYFSMEAFEENLMSILHMVEYKQKSYYT